MSAAPVDQPGTPVPGSALDAPTAKAPDERAADAVRCVRLLDLRYWLRGLGCCWACALRLALAQVEREAGAKFDPGGECVAPDNGCRDKARAMWKTMPAKKPA